MQALAKDPAHRYQTAEEFTAALEAARHAMDDGRRGGPGHGRVRARHDGAAAEEEDYEEWHEERPRAPPPRHRAGLGALILALLAAVAFGAYTLLAPEQVNVPDVVGKPLLEASLELERQGFEVRELRVTGPRAGGPGDRAGPGRRRRGGQGLRDPAHRVGRPGPRRACPTSPASASARAARELKQAGFVFTQDDEASDEVEKGRVIRQSPGGGESADVGTRVRLIVSTGPEQVTVPNLVGLSRGSAESALDRAGLDAEVDEENSEQPAGRGAPPEPAQGTLVDKGSRVTSS